MLSVSSDRFCIRIVVRFCLAIMMILLFLHFFVLLTSTTYISSLNEFIKIYYLLVYVIASFGVHFLGWFDVFWKDPFFLLLLWNRRLHYTRIPWIMLNLIETKLHVTNKEFKISEFHSFQPKDWKYIWYKNWHVRICLSYTLTMQNIN